MALVSIAAARMLVNAAQGRSGTPLPSGNLLRLPLRAVLTHAFAFQSPLVVILAYVFLFIPVQDETIGLLFAAPRVFTLVLVTVSRRAPKMGIVDVLLQGAKYAALIFIPWVNTRKEP